MGSDSKVFYVIKHFGNYVTGVVQGLGFANNVPDLSRAKQYATVEAALTEIGKRAIATNIAGGRNEIVRVEETTVPSTPSIEEVREGEVLPVNCQWAVKWHERFLTVPPKAVSNFMAESLNDNAALFPTQQAALDALVKAQAVNGQGLTYLGAQLVRVRVTNSDAKITRTETILA